MKSHRMSTPDTCPICLVEYTVSEIHKPAALKCGHLFGYSCLSRWFKDSRNALCPTCAKPCRKNDIRVIFATSIRTNDSEKEKELLQKYHDSKNLAESLKLENSHLKTTIEYLQNEIIKLELKLKNNEDMKLCIINKNGDLKDLESYKRFKFTRKLKSKNINSIILFDKTNPAVYISSRDNYSVGYKKIGYECESFEYYPFFVKIDDSSFICDMKMSCFNDGLILIAYDKNIKLINSINGNELLFIKIENKVRCVGFDNKDRNIIYYGDDKSFLNIYDLRQLKTIKIIKVDSGLHSMAKIENFLYVGCVFNWFKIHTKANNYLSEKMEIDENLKCINLMADNNKMLVTFRDERMKTIHFIYHKGNQPFKKSSEFSVSQKINDDVDVNIEDYSCDEDQNTFVNSSILLSRCTQYKRRNDKIAEDAIYICNENGNTIEVYSTINFRSIDVYKFRENVVDFIVYKKRMYVITDNYINFLER